MNEFKFVLRNQDAFQNEPHVCVSVSLELCLFVFCLKSNTMHAKSIRQNKTSTKS